MQNLKCANVPGCSPKYIYIYIERERGRESIKEIKMLHKKFKGIKLVKS